MKQKHKDEIRDLLKETKEDTAIIFCNGNYYRVMPGTYMLIGPYDVGRELQKDPDLIIFTINQEVWDSKKQIFVRNEPAPEAFPGRKAQIIDVDSWEVVKQFMELRMGGEPFSMEGKQVKHTKEVCTAPGTYLVHNEILRKG